MDDDAAPKGGRVEEGVYYHGSPYLFETLRAGSYVTPHRRDAKVFAVPWSTDDLALTEEDTDPTRPPTRLSFKEPPPPDHPIHIYEVRARTKPTHTNTGQSSDWNRVTLDDTPVRLIETLPSWHDELLREHAVMSTVMTEIDGKYHPEPPEDNDHD